MSTLDYPLRVRHRRSQELIAETLDFAITHRAIRGHAVDTARQLIREIVELLLLRKAIEETEERRIRNRWSDYLPGEERRAS